MSSKGTVAERAEESDEASKILGLKVRENLGFSDRHITITDDYLEPVVNMMRISSPDNCHSTLLD
jgi:N-acetylglucosamine malate deacetylase 1